MKRSISFYKLLFVALLTAGSASLCARSTHWRIEAESPETRILLRGDTLDITAPQGLSLWWDQPLTAPCTIEYRACVVADAGPYDRLSDLNCFWMASLPPGGDSPLPSIPLRGGRFAESYRLQCYYLGYGGNYNTTTRFRRYDGDTRAISDPSRRPPVLKEYTDSTHLLRPNHWYEVRIEVTHDGHSIYYLDHQPLVDYRDPAPLLHGWFAFRTTFSHIRLTAFRISTCKNETLTK